MLEGARSIGMPTFESNNGRMMEGAGGASLVDMLTRDGKRQSIFRAYTFPYMGRPNLTVLSNALVTRLTFEGSRATGVELSYQGQTYRLRANLEVVLSLGAIHTPKVLMQSGIGDQAELQRLGIPLLQHLPGVGKNFQDHPAFGCVWECAETLDARNTMCEATFFWRSKTGIDTPDLQTCQAEIPFSSAENAARFGMPPSGRSLFGGVVRPKSRGRIRLTGPILRTPFRLRLISSRSRTTCKLQ